MSTFTPSFGEYLSDDPLIGSLHLAYFAAEVTLHRAIIRFDLTNIDDHLRGITRAAAKMRFTSAIDLVSKLEPAHLQSFWYFASKVNLAIIGTFGSLLWATSDNADEAEFYRSQLGEYRWTLRVSSKSAEFMKFTVGMLDAGAVFLKDGSSKTGTPTAVREKPSNEDTKKEETEPFQDDQAQEARPDQPIQNFNQNVYGTNEVSPSVGNSTDSAYPYEPDFNGGGLQVTRDTRPTWAGLATSVNFTAGDVQDWSLDQLYNFESFQGVEDALANRPFIEEYDEAGNNFAGF